MSMLSKEFRAFDPFLTFSNPENLHFILPNGKDGGALDRDTYKLFRTARKAYSYLPNYENKKAFDEAVASSRVRIADARKAAEYFVDRAAERKEPDLIELQGRDLSFVIDSFAGTLLRAMITGPAVEPTDGTMQWMAYNYIPVCLHYALIEVDNALASARSPGAIFSAMAANAALWAVEAGKWSERGASALIRSRAVKAANARLERDPKQAAKEFVFMCWTAWKEDPSKYSSKAAFARDMLTKKPELISQKKIEDWCRDWERTRNPAR